MKQRILLAEDDAALVKVLRNNLEFEGFEVSCVTNGGAAIVKAREFIPDLVLLDIMLPGLSGFEVCERLRMIGGAMSIVFLTARSQKPDKLSGLNLGADDYITKPFDLEELLARLHAVLRRGRSAVERLTLGSITIDFAASWAMQKDRRLWLTYREFELLKYLNERSGRVVYRVELLRDIWGYADQPTTRSVDHAIARLRKKIEPDPQDPQFIHTVHGYGYQLTPEGRRGGPAGEASIAGE